MNMQNSNISIEWRDAPHYASTESNQEVNIIGNQEIGGEIAVAGDENTITARVKSARTAITGSDTAATIVGDDTKTAVSGSLINVRLIGDDALLASCGIEADIKVNGDGTELAAARMNGNITIEGDYSTVASCGDGASIAVTGSCARIAVLGDDNDIIQTGENGLLLLDGRDAKFRAEKGTLVIAVVYDANDNNRAIGGLIGRIGENGLRENTNYTVKNGQFIEMPTMDDNA